MQISQPKLVVTREQHPKLYHFLRHHPEIFEVFHNIEKDRPLDMGVILSSGDSKDIVKVYIESLHLPLLMECNAIRENENRQCGFETLVSGMEYLAYDSVNMATVAADRAAALSKVVKPTDNRQNALFCYYHGLEESVPASKSLLDRMRGLILEHASNPGKAEPGDEGMSFDMIISARISKYEPSK